jgi:hypothetical protein
MTSGKPLKVKYLTTINWKRSPLFLYSSYGDPICSKRDFLWFDTRNGKQFPQYWKNDPEGGKTYMKLSFISATKTTWTEHQRRLF